MFKNFVIKFPCVKEGYALINGELTYVKFVTVTVDVESNNQFVMCESPDGYKNSFKIDELFASVADYEKGNSVKTCDLDLNSRFPGNYEEVKNDEEGLFFKKSYWVMVDGEPEKRYLDAKRIVWSAERPYRHLSGIDLPKETFNSREECIAWNDITIVEEDGTKRVQKSVKRALMLTDEQRLIIDEVREAMEKAKAAGVVFGYNNDYMEWIGLNKTEYPDVRFEWSDSISEEEEKDAIWCSKRDVRDHYRIDLPLPAFVTECERAIVPVPKD